LLWFAAAKFVTAHRPSDAAKVTDGECTVLFSGRRVGPNRLRKPTHSREQRPSGGVGLASARAARPEETAGVCLTSAHNCRGARLHGLDSHMTPINFGRPLFSAQSGGSILRGTTAPTSTRPWEKRPGCVPPAASRAPFGRPCRASPRPNVIRLKHWLLAQIALRPPRRATPLPFRPKTHGTGSSVKCTDLVERFSLPCPVPHLRGSAGPPLFRHASTRTSLPMA